MFKRAKYGCYAANVSMSVVGNLSPLLFITFHKAYGISYSLLGLLVLVNFCTQLTVDLIFSFFSHKFNIKLTVKSIPFFTIAGLLIFALSPLIFPNAVYIGLLIGTIIFSASGGLSEVLISPVIAAIPSKNPEREMSKLHSIYAWGVVAVILLSTLFLLVFDYSMWPVLALIFTAVPLTSAILFVGAKLPDMKTPDKTASALHYLKNKQLWICVFAIFLGGAAECTMAQWSSSYLEAALGIPKALGDIFGVAMFGLALGLGRSLYAKGGKNIEKVLLLCAIGASLCYIIAALSPIAIIGLLAAAFCGFSTSMLWPGSLIVAEKKFPFGGVFIYAMMASGGDLGASVVPQLLGIITDKVAESELAMQIGSKLSISAEQLGMRAGMLVAALFPIIAIFVFSYILKSKRKEEKINDGEHS